MFGWFSSHRRNGSEEPVRDPALGGAFRLLDPGSSDLSYWSRFHRSVMAGAAFELARRRRVAEFTVSDVVVSWSRALIPAAMAAAVAAVALATRPGAESPLPMRIEELLTEGVEAAAVDVDQEVDITFAADRF